MHTGRVSSFHGLLHMGLAYKADVSCSLVSGSSTDTASTGSAHELPNALRALPPMAWLEVLKILNAGI
jgi:hypothetical protein